MSVVVFENFLSKDECNELNDWVQQGPLKGALVPGPDGKGLTDYSLKSKTRFSTRGMRRSNIVYPPIAYSIQERITNTCKLQNLHFSTRGGLRGIIVNSTQPGGDIWEHLDSTENYSDTPPEAPVHVLRCNVITQKPEHGGELFVNNKKVNLNAGDLHCYLVSKHPHYVTENKGTVDRICWLFGYQVPTSDSRFSQWV